MMYTFYVPIRIPSSHTYIIVLMMVCGIILSRDIMFYNIQSYCSLCYCICFLYDIADVFIIMYLTYHTYGTMVSRRSVNGWTNPFIYIFTNLEINFTIKKLVFVKRKCGKPMAINTHIFNVCVICLHMRNSLIFYISLEINHNNTM